MFPNCHPISHNHVLHVKLPDCTFNIPVKIVMQPPTAGHRTDLVWRGQVIFDDTFEIPPKLKVFKLKSKLINELHRVVNKLTDPHDMARRLEIGTSGMKVIKLQQLDQYEEDGKILSDYTKKCHICLNEYIPDKSVRVMNCRHAFHRICIDKWFMQGKDSCPVCRSENVVNQFDYHDDLSISLGKANVQNNGISFEPLKIKIYYHHKHKNTPLSEELC